jgi:hypothetical protein
LGVGKSAATIAAAIFRGCIIASSRVGAVAVCALAMDSIKVPASAAGNIIPACNAEDFRTLFMKPLMMRKAMQTQTA